jgi:sigma-B regulation protein RsbU (phosphoserine phosphatase)
MTESNQVAGRLACFELWGGNSRAAHPIELPGLMGWVSCTPYGQAEHGGDVHYLSVCSKGQVSRIAIADVAGHGESASSVADRLREVLQQHTDNWDQSALMREINEAFKPDVTGGRFATAAVLGFYAGTGELLFSNAGHLPLLWHHAESGIWDWLEEGTAHAKDVAGLPLGLISGTAYSQIGVELNPGDTLLLYTDGVTESRNEAGEELGHEGLLGLVRGLALSPDHGPIEFGQALSAGLNAFRGRNPQRDDETLLLLRREAGCEQIV